MLNFWRLPSCRLRGGKYDWSDLSLCIIVTDWIYVYKLWHLNRWCAVRVTPPWWCTLVPGNRVLWVLSATQTQSRQYCLGQCAWPACDNVILFVVMMHLIQQCTCVSGSVVDPCWWKGPISKASSARWMPGTSAVCKRTRPWINTKWWKRPSTRKRVKSRWTLAGDSSI